MQHIIIGTAGHIDHGKTALIKALSGFDGDNTVEEKQRGITINLSFSSIQDEHKNIAFIDVPGHEKLIKNMIAGAFGFDACLLVVDAKEGIMPQSIEHLEILNLLDIHNIVIALSKSDLVSGTALQEQTENIRIFMKRFTNITVNAIVPTSIYNTNSIEVLKKELFLMPKIDKKSNGLFRYYIDRSFNLAGVGSVVTGTVLDGEVRALDKLFVTDVDKEVIVRNVQVHDKDVPLASVSNRAAINLKNTKIQLKTGMLLSKKGYLRGFHSIDVWVRTIGDRVLKHNSSVLFFVGTKKVEAKVLLLEEEQILEESFARIEFKEKVFCIYNEPFIVSVASRVVAGGRVLNPINDPLKKRKKTSLLVALQSKDFQLAFDILVDSHKKGFGLISSYQRFGLSHGEALDIAQDMGNIFVDEKSLVVYPLSTQQELEKIILDIYTKNHFAMLSSKSITFKISWASESLIQSCLENLANKKVICLENGIYKNANISIDNMEALIENKIYDLLIASKYAPDAPYNIYDSLDIDRLKGDNALKKLTSSKKVARLAHNLFIPSINLSTLMQELREMIKKEKYIDVQMLKNHYKLSRKYAICYLEHLDKYGDIVSDGVKRSLAKI